MSLSPILRRICRTECIAYMYKLLFSNGDFTTCSNEVVTDCRRINPDDFDGDGLANEIDPNPLVCDGDLYGVANALPSNANQNTYYWLDLCATGAPQALSAPVGVRRRGVPARDGPWGVSRRPRLAVIPRGKISGRLTK